MKKIGKYLLTTSLIGLAALGLAACSSTQSQSGNANGVKVGILQYMEHDSLTAAREGFKAELADNGYKEGEKLTLDYQNAQGDQANLQTISEQLASNNDLVLAIATPAAQSLATASTDTPILFTAVTDPLSADLVESIKKPGGLLTGTRHRLTNRFNCWDKRYRMPKQLEFFTTRVNEIRKSRSKQLNPCLKKRAIKWS